MKVILSKRARNKLDILLDYLETEWSKKDKNNFIKKLDRSILQISTQPESYPESKEKKGIYKCVVCKQTTIYYRIKPKSIEIITLFDTRQNPKRLKKEI